MINMPPSTPCRPQIFVSHSARDGHPRAVRDAIVECLRAEGFKVLIDDRLIRSKPWRSEIDRWIRECDAALLILSTEAVSSKYVSYEATLLRDRAQRQPDLFPFVPLRFSDVTDDLLKKHMDPLQLGEIQHVSVVVETTDVHMMAEKALESGKQAWKDVRELLQPLSRRQPRHEIEQWLIDLLSAHFSDESLREMHERLALGGPVAFKKDQCIMLARVLLDFNNASLGQDRFDKVMSIASCMYANMEQEAAQAAINCIVPFCWVHPEAANMLERVASVERKPVAWRRTWDLSEQMYLRRALCKRNVTYVPVSGADAWGGDRAEFINHTRNCLVEALCLGKSANDAQLERALQRKSPIFLGIPANGFDNELLHEVRRRWHGVVGFLHSPGLTPTVLTAMNFDEVSFVEPELDIDAETDARIAWGDLMKTIGVDPETINSGKAFL